MLRRSLTLFGPTWRAAAPVRRTVGFGAWVMSVAVLAGGAFADDAHSEVASVARQSPPPVAAPAPAAPDLGANPIQRFFAYQAWEIGKAGPPSDPNAPASRRSPWPSQPATSPPMPFTEWPYGGTTDIGVNRASSVDSPLMAAIADTGLGKAMSDAHIQAYGWFDFGGNLSSSSVRGGNSPAAYDYNPNRLQMDQAVLYVERTPDTVQTDHVDWGFRISALYGTDYRYTTAYGIASYQLLKYNKAYGYDFPMVYGEVYVPNILKGLIIRFGRYIALPDIEAQLAPNNYMYSHSLTYTFDNYTNTGVQGTLAVTRNVFVQLGVSVGSDTALWNAGARLPNLYVLAGNPDPLYPGKTLLKDPGAVPSVTACLRMQSNSASDNVYFCADAINHGQYGYNNLQWLGMTYYHRFDDHWHVAFETWHIQENGVPNLNNPASQAIIAGGGEPFSPQFLPFNAPAGAYCRNAGALTCNAPEQTALFYLNYSPEALDNFSLRGEVFDDIVGQRTGVATTYYEAALGWQHWVSPQIEMRPEISWYHSANAPAFNGNGDMGVPPDKKTQVVAAGDLIVHF